MNTIKVLDVAARWKVLCVIYRDSTTDSAENEVKIIPYSDGVAKYLSNRVGTTTDISEINANGVIWVDESKSYHNGLEIQIEYTDEVLKSIEQFCSEHELTSEKLFYGISCFMCNPAYEDLVFGWLKDTLENHQTNGDPMISVHTVFPNADKCVIFIETKPLATNSLE